MAEVLSPTRPAWQTAELTDEWVEQSVHDEDNVSFGTGSVSLTVPLTTEIRTNSSDMSPFNMSSKPVGTFIVRKDVPPTPLLPKTPIRHNKKGLLKDFFSPLPLERMFEPPSPPFNDSHSPRNSRPNTSRRTRPRGSDYGKESEPDLPQTSVADVSNPPIPDRSRTDIKNYRFTFTVPPPSSHEHGFQHLRMQVQSTPDPPATTRVLSQAPGTDPRLRLFQFQYDTFTRDHLSAMVDSIAINTPSGASATRSSGTRSQGLSRVSDVTQTDTSRLRSAKRLKISPRGDIYGEDAAISRSKRARKDYVGESQSLMMKIKQARDFSTITTTPSVDSPASHRDHPNTLKKTRSSGSFVILACKLYTDVLVDSTSAFARQWISIRHGCRHI